MSTFIISKDEFVARAGTRVNPYTSVIVEQTGVGDDQTRCFICEWEAEPTVRSTTTAAYLSTIAARAARLPHLAEPHQFPRLAVFQADDNPLDAPSVSWESHVDWSDIRLIPDIYYYDACGYENYLPHADLAWKDRRRQLLWRGSTTGFIGLRAVDFGHLPRYRLCALAKALGEFADVKISSVVQTASHDDHHAISDRIGAEQIYGGFLPMDDMALARMVVDIDGNANSWNFMAKLRLGCCVLKVESNWQQWYSTRLKPWEHYVPVASDLSDFYERVAWCLAYDDKTEAIAERGRQFALDMRFDDEMNAAAAKLFRGGSAFDDDRPVSLSPFTAWPSSAVPLAERTVAAYSSEGMIATIAHYDASNSVFKPMRRLPAASHIEFGAFSRGVADEAARVVTVLRAVENADPDFQMISLGAAPGEAVVLAKRVFCALGRTGSFHAKCVDGDLDHCVMTREFLALNGVQPGDYTLDYVAVAERAGFAYFPIINAAVDWGSGLAALADDPAALDQHMRVSDAFLADRLAPTGGASLRFRTVPAVTLASLRPDSGVVDLVQSDVQGIEGLIFTDATLADLSTWARTCSINTHSASIHDDVATVFARAGWTREFDQPPLIEASDRGEICLRDGIGIWSNPALAIASTAADPA